MAGERIKAANTSTLSGGHRAPRARTTVGRRLVTVTALVCVAAALTAPVASAEPHFVTVPGELAEGVYGPGAATLPDGKVLVAGGYSQAAKKDVKSAELFDPATESFAPVGAELLIARSEPRFVSLPDGDVLIVGGYNQAEQHLSTAELYDPTTKTFKLTAGKMHTQRDGAGAAVLPNGKVLIVAGYNDASEYQRTAELYDPASETFEAIPATLAIGRYQPIADTLPNGKVLVSGGYNTAEKDLASAELYNPATNSFESLQGAGSEMTQKRDEAGSAVLQNGKVLIVGGYNAKDGSLATAELFNPETNTFEAVASPLTEERDAPAAATLADGRVLVVGGEGVKPAYPTKVEITTFTLASVSTGAAAAIGTSSATLTGVVTGETASTAHYQYGTTTAYDSSTAAQGVAASIAGRSAAIGIGGLTSGTTYHFRIVAEGGAGMSYGPDQTFNTLAATVTPTPPTLSAATQSHRVWRTGGSLASISRKAKTPVGTVFSFSLNEQANVRLTFTQVRGGRRVKGRCVAPKHRNHHAHRCHRTVTIGVVSLTGHAGTDHVAFQGRISSSVRLRPGSYSVMISAVNAAGQRSGVQRLAFTIVR